jgi:hypothetical protein
MSTMALPKQGRGAFNYYERIMNYYEFLTALVKCETTIGLWLGKNRNIFILKKKIADGY